MTDLTLPACDAHFLHLRSRRDEIWSYTGKSFCSPDQAHLEVFDQFQLSKSQLSFTQLRNEKSKYKAALWDEAFDN